MTETSSSRWLREFKRFLPLKSLFLLHGNIYDLLLYPVKSGDETCWAYFPLRKLLHRFFSDEQYRCVAYYDIVDGISFMTKEEMEIFQKAEKPVNVDRVEKSDSESGHGKKELTICNQDRGKSSSFMSQPAMPHLRDFDAALDAVRRALFASNEPMAIVIDFASRLFGSTENLAQQERRQFVKLLKCVEEATIKKQGKASNHVLVLISDRLTDLPAWLYLHHPLVKPLQIGLPDQEERRIYFESALDGFYHGQVSDNDKSDSVESFIDLSGGLTNYELECLRRVSLKEFITFDEPKKIIEHYKFGLVESAWDRLKQGKGREKLARADEILRERVKGQEAAIHAVVDIIKRASAGLSGIHHSAAALKPKGVLFFAGPTGVGKTEMARSLAELLFGDENVCIRFDMSEYAQEHSDQKLLGAPPGYIGYEEGGQLTNKIKESPFAVLLFDEIEKAHPKIMDKFLQILEDGRMTDSKGETVYFSEAVIIFTSNIGAYIDEPLGDGTYLRKPNILPLAWRCHECGNFSFYKDNPLTCSCGYEEFERVETPYQEVKKRVLTAVEEHFKFKLGRPEIYNRIGNNFVVFDYIRKPVVKQIIKRVLDNIGRELEEKNRIEVRFEVSVYDYLQDKVVEDIEYGGRGIGNLIETVLVNPLARYIFDMEVTDASLVVEKINESSLGEQVVYELEITK